MRAQAQSVSLIIHRCLFSDISCYCEKNKVLLHSAHADGDEPFDVAVEDAIAGRRVVNRARGSKSKVGSSLPRHVRDKKFVFGAYGKRDKKNTRFDGSARRGSSTGLRGRSGP